MQKEDFAEELVTLRSSTGLSQEDFGKKLGTSKRSISSWENGDGFPRKSFRILLATTFGLPATRFLLEDELPTGCTDTSGNIYDELQSPELRNAIQNFVMKT